MSKVPLEGVWSLVSYTARSASGEEALPFGEEPMGRLIYTPTGHVSATLCRTPRPRFASADRKMGTDGELRVASDGFDAYAGTYEIDAATNRVVHHVALSSWPNIMGTDQVRYFALDNEDLVLTTPPMLSRGSAWVLTLKWRRLT